MPQTFGRQYSCTVPVGIILRGGLFVAAGVTFQNRGLAHNENAAMAYCHTAIRRYVRLPGYVATANR